MKSLYFLVQSSSIETKTLLTMEFPLRLCQYLAHSFDEGAVWNLLTTGDRVRAKLTESCRIASKRAGLLNLQTKSKGIKTEVDCINQHDGLLMALDCDHRVEKLQARIAVLNDFTALGVLSQRPWHKIPLGKWISGRSLIYAIRSRHINRRLFEQAQVFVDWKVPSWHQ
ncbi:hypothetical protein KUV57_11460 [Epibacterium sp. DP7N7-1]|nr:hypothetical protein [Epibacterium sp. DP7N7-1]